MTFSTSTVTLRILRTQTKGIVKVGHAIVRVGIKVLLASKSDRVFTDEPTDLWVVVSGAVVTQVAFGIKVSPSVLERVCDAAGRSGQFPEGIVGVAVGNCSRAVRKRRNGAQTIRFVESVRARTRFCQGFVDVLSLRVAREDGATCIEFLDVVVPVVEIVRGRRCARGEDLLNPSSEGIILEARCVQQTDTDRLCLFIWVCP